MWFRWTFPRLRIDQLLTLRMEIFITDQHVQFIIGNSNVAILGLAFLIPLRLAEEGDCGKSCINLI